MPDKARLSRLLDSLVRHADGVLLVLSAALALWGFFVLLQVAQLDPNIVRAQWVFNAHDFWAVLARWGDTGLADYRAHFASDHVLALLYGAWGALMVARSGLFDGLDARRRWLAAALLPLAALFDLLENAAHLYLLALPEADGAAQIAALAAATRPPGQWLVPVAGGFSAVKWTASVAWLAWLGWATVRRWWPVWSAELELRVPPLVVLLLTAAAMAAADLWLPEWRLPWHGPLVWAASIGMALAGAALGLAGVRAFQRAATTVNPLAPGEARVLVTEGVFQRTRNPMYLGMAAALIGWAIWLSQPLAGLGVPLFWLYLQRFQVVPEERAMAARFGPAFRLYCRKVPRWL